MDTTKRSKQMADDMFSEITGPLTSRKAMRAQRELLRVTLNSIGDAVIATDAAGQVTYMNSVAENLTGWPSAEGVGKSLEQVLKIVDEETHQACENPAERVLREQAVVGLANHSILIAKDGRRTSIDDTGAPIRDAKGNVIGVVLVFRDVTEQRHADRDISRLAAIVKSSDDAIISITLDGTILSWNPAAEKLFGYTPEEVAGKPITTIYLPDRYHEFDEIMARLRRGESVDHFDTVRMAKDGRRVDVSMSISLLRDAQGNIIGASKIIRDISERKRADDVAQFLNQASEVLSSSLDYETTLVSLARLAVPKIADWCQVQIKAEDGSLQQLALAHVDPKKVELARELQKRYPPNDDAPNGVHQVVRTGKAQLLPEITDSMIAATAKDVEHLKMLVELNIRSAMTVPITTRGRTLGAISFVSSESGRRYGSADLVLAQDLARRAGIAIDNARLYREAQALNEQLEERVIRRTIELQNVNRKLEMEAAQRQRMTDQLRQLSGHLQSAREQERISIAREIHDEIGQVLTAIKMDLSLLSRDVAGNGAKLSPRATSDKIEATAKLVDEALEMMHHIVRELRPEVLDHLGLRAALEWQIQEFQSRTKIKSQFNAPSNETDPDPERSTAVFRILQETLTNITRHAEATSVEVNFWEEDRTLILQVSDNGKGITESALNTSSRFGILGMHERARAFGGEVTINGAPDGGTVVVARIPL